MTTTTDEKDDVQLKDLEKGDAGGDLVDNSTEKSPLKESDKDHDETSKEVLENGIKEVKANPLLETLRDPKTRLTVAIIAFVLLLVFVTAVVVTVLIIGTKSEPEKWIEDPVARMLRLVPTPNGDKNLIKFRSGISPQESGNTPNMTEEISNLFDRYEEKNNIGVKNVTNCDNRVSPPGNEQLTCFYNTDEIRKQCNSETGNYGYATGSPCIFIQFNHVANFTPEVFSKEDLQNTDLPESLRSSYRYTGPWVECKPNDPIDVENAGAIRVIPGNELPRSHFPYKGHPDYMAPFIALKFDKPVHSVAIGITCRLWARNLIFNATTSGFNDTQVDDQFVPSAILPFNLFVE